MIQMVHVREKMCATPCNQEEKDHITCGVDYYVSTNVRLAHIDSCSSAF